MADDEHLIEVRSLDRPNRLTASMSIVKIAPVPIFRAAASLHPFCYARLFDCVRRCESNVVVDPCSTLQLHHKAVWRLGVPKGVYRPMPPT